MSSSAIATLQTPWDCRWSRFGRMRVKGPNARSEGLWVCVHDGARQSISEADCATCPYWEFNSPAASQPDWPAAATTAHDAPFVSACPHPGRAEKRLEVGVRVAALALAVVFAVTGFAVFTRPLAMPLAISMWTGAITCLLLAIWGNLNRRSLPGSPGHRT